MAKKVFTFDKTKKDCWLKVRAEMLLDAHRKHDQDIIRDAILNLDFSCFDHNDWFLLYDYLGVQPLRNDFENAIYQLASLAFLTGGFG